MSLPWLVVTVVSGSHSAIRWQFSAWIGLIAKVIALVVEKSLSCRHNPRLDNVLGQ